MYIAVIEKEIIKAEQVERFIGKCIEKVYNLKGMGILSNLFNGDLIKIEECRGNNFDFIVGNKGYIVKSEISDKDSLDKLEKFLSMFKDIEYILDNDNDNSIHEESRENKKILKLNKTKIIAVQLKSIDNIIYNGEDIKIIDIKYIGNNKSTYRIENCKNMEEKAVKGILAIMALEMEAKESNDVLLNYKQVDWEVTNNFIRRYAFENNSYSKLPNTEYYIVNTMSVRDTIALIEDISDRLGINSEDKFIYLEIEEKSIGTNEYDIEEGTINIEDTLGYSKEKNASEEIIIKGDIFNNIIISDRGIELIGKLIGSAGKVIIHDKEYNNLEEVIDILEEIKIVGPEEDELTGPQLILTVLNSVTEMFNSTSVAMKCKLDFDAYKYSKYSEKTSDPIYGISKVSILNYLSNKISH